MTTVVPLKGHAAPKASRSSMETMLVTIEEVNQWRLPPFQRPLRVNEKVRAMSESLKDEGGMISGVVTLGRIAGDSKTSYLVDGQHRMEAFRLSGLAEAIVDVRLCTFDNMAEMAEEFVQLNTALVRMRPDDVLRGLEGTVPALRKIREQCAFVGYDNIRRGGNSTSTVGMSAVIRCWVAGGNETPTPGAAGGSAAALAAGLDEVSGDHLIRFLNLCKAAWGRDHEYFRLWGNLNLVLCMWLYRKLVLDRERGVRRYVVLTNDEFKKCLMALSADADYLDWLPGRVLGDRDRAPAFTRIKAAFAARLHTEIGKKTILPLPTWATK